MVFIKLIHDKYENENQNKEHIHNVIKEVNGNQIDKERELMICTWGKNKHLPYECEIIFDISSMSTNVINNETTRNYTGMDEIIQNSIINHPKFDYMMEEMLMNIETGNPKVIGIICNYGKHRSVGMAELLKKFYYEKSIMLHRGI